MDETRVKQIASELKLSQKLVQLVADAIGEDAELTVVDKRGSWYYLSDGSKVNGKANLPEGVTV